MRSTTTSVLTQERGRCGTRMHIRMIFKQLETGAGSNLVPGSRCISLQTGEHQAGTRPICALR